MDGRRLLSESTVRDRIAFRHADGLADPVPTPPVALGHGVHDRSAPGSRCWAPDSFGHDGADGADGSLAFGNLRLRAGFAYIPNQMGGLPDHRANALCTALRRGVTESIQPRSRVSPVAARTSVSMKDVATLAGVSVGTVSNVLNSPDLVSPATRERVRQAIDKLGWVRNESARQLRAGRSRSVGMVVIDIANPFFTDVVLGAEDQFYAAGYAVHVGNSAQTAEREMAHLALFEEQRVRGILVAPVRDMTDRIAELRRRGIAIVVVDRMGTSNDLCSVGVDDLEGGRLAVQHLVDQGHRSIAFVGGPSSLHQVRDRRTGAELATARAGDPAVLLAISTPSLDVESGVRAAAELAALPDGERPTAVFAANDLVAIGLLQGFVTAGVAVPDEMAIIGYDDIAFAAAAAVPLSSIRQPRAELGRRAAELLLAEIDAADGDGPHQHEQVRFVPELVVRRSTIAATRPRPNP